MNEIERAEKIERAKAKKSALYKRLFASEEGRAVLADLETLFRYRESAFIPVSKGDHKSYDPLTAALTDGGRRVVCYINEQINRPDNPIQSPKPEVIKK